MASPIDPTLRALARHRMIIEVTCTGCHRTTLFDPAFLAQTKNPLSDFRRLRFRCAECGSRRSTVRAYPDDWQQ